VKLQDIILYNPNIGDVLGGIGEAIKLRFALPNTVRKKTIGTREPLISGTGIMQPREFAIQGFQ